MNSKNIYCVILGLVLFSIVFICFAAAIKQTWFREDDLGTIINGRVKDLRSAIRIFATDCRSFITPCNYQRTVPNFLSALWRPLQNYIFSIIFYLFGPNPMAFYLLQVSFHAANAALLFILFSLLVPLWLAFFGGLMFSFYPNVDWMIWASTLQNSLSVFFLILMLICLCTPKKHIYVAGLFYFLSLLSRESGIFLPIWLWLGAFIYFMAQNYGFQTSICLALKKCWIFFAANLAYSLLRILAFGFGTLDRTFSNLFLRFPFLNKFFAQTKNVAANQAVYAPSLAVSSSTTPATDAALNATSANGVCNRSSFFEILWEKILNWIDAILNIPTQTSTEQIFAIVIVLILIVFIIYAYRKNLILMLWLGLGLGCLIWPSILLYPSPRYINAAYPMLVFIFIYGIYLFYNFNKKLIGKLICVIILGSASVLGLHGIKTNWNALNFYANERINYKKRFDVFFAQHKFKPNTNFILICSPYVSDIESIFQFYLNDYSARVVFDPFTTIAEHGTMGCNGDYKASGVKSEIKKIDGGFRLISYDENHCGWWLRHSNFNVAWSRKDRAYRWTDQSYVPNIWYECSIGQFMIHKMVGPDLITDVSFIYDKKWVDINTVFVAWNTIAGEYYTID